MDSCPSAAQLDEFDRRSADRPVVLFFQYSLDRSAGPAGNAAFLSALAARAKRHAGALVWAAAQEQALVGAVGEHDYACRLRFDSRREARAFIEDAEHVRELRQATALQVAVLSNPPRAIAPIFGLLAKLLPWLPFDNSTDPGEEPGVGTSGIMPTRQAVAELKAHREQNTPVVMINWLKFRAEARYPVAAEPVSGRTAYRRYGKVALLAAFSLMARLVFIARYQQMLIGNGGDPGTGLWDEFVLMQYPGRAVFARMVALRRYRRALHHREAGLTETGQGLTVSRPCPEYLRRG